MIAGTTSRLDSLQAAVLRAKLPYLRGWTEGRARNARVYAEELAAVKELQAKPPVYADVLAALDDEAALAAGQATFETSCFACHGKLGEGGIGPNLTDDHFLNVKQLTDISNVLVNGVVAKGMPAWDTKLTETQIVLLSAYVARMRQNPIPGEFTPHLW